MIQNLHIASISLSATRAHLQQALSDAGAIEALAIMPMLETTARLLQDLDALQSAVKADGEAK